MRKMLFLLPELDMQHGGHQAQLAFYRLAANYCQAKIITYLQRCEGIDYLDDVLEGKHYQGAIFVVHWGPDVSGLLHRLEGLPVVYVAHSTGWSLSLPPTVPVLAVSRHTQAYWGKHAPASPIFYLPNIIEDEFYNSAQLRRNDVLIMKRKSSAYVFDQLLPLLTSQCRVKVIDGWVDNLADEMRHSKVFLYDSTEHWQNSGVSEGFGLPPLEAMACGCQIFSSLNDALSDYLDPGVNCEQIGVISADYDAQRIIKAVKHWQWQCGEDPAEQWREAQVAPRFKRLMAELNALFDYQMGGQPTPAEAISKPYNNPDDYSLLQRFKNKFSQKGLV